MMTKKKFLFVCVENAGRSQMAEAFFRKHAPNFLVTSAGTKPVSEINPIVVEAMKEKGIEMNNQHPKILNQEMINDSTTINMGCMDKETCPALFVENIQDWQILDPKGKSLTDVREIRDQIEAKVINLVSNLNEEK